MADQIKERPKINDLSLRRVTRYIDLLVKEWERYGRPNLSPREEAAPQPDYHAPSIPDPWDIERAARAIVPAKPEESGSQPGSESSASLADPWATGQNTQALYPAEEQLTSKLLDISIKDDGDMSWVTSADSEDQVPLPWEDQEDDVGTVSAPIPSFASEQDREDFARAMMYLNNTDDDFLVTGVGKRTGDSTAESILQAQFTVQPSEAHDTSFKKGLSPNPQRQTARVGSPINKDKTSSAIRQTARDSSGHFTADLPLRTSEQPPTSPYKARGRLKTALFIALTLLLVAAIALGSLYWFFIRPQDSAPKTINASVFSTLSAAR